MKICIAQIRPVAGNVEKNIEKHHAYIESAVSRDSDVVCFPELSITGYEPKLAKQLAMDHHDRRFDVFQKISNTRHITIAAGVPIKGDDGIMISMIIFQPDKERLIYSKQMLHADEEPYFVNGWQQVILPFEREKVAPAICYESLQPGHSANAVKIGATVYLTSVAKSTKGVSRAYKHYPDIAKKYSMIVMMSNCLGPCDDFEGVGQSAIWNRDGNLVGQLNDTDEGLLVFDTESGVLV